LEITVAVHVAVQLTQRVRKPFDGGAGGARTHDPRIRFVGADTFQE